MLEGLASDRGVENGGLMRKVRPLYRPKTDVTGVLQRLEFGERNYFAVSAYCEPGASRPQRHGGSVRTKRRDVTFEKSGSLLSPNDM